MRLVIPIILKKANDIILTAAGEKTCGNNPDIGTKLSSLMYEEAMSPINARPVTIFQFLFKKRVK